MDGLNRVQLIGNLGADPELKMTASGHPLMKLSLATNESWRDKDNVTHDKTEWHRVTVFGKPAEALSKFVKKGWKIYVEGRIEHSSYEKEGQKHYSTDIVATRVLALGPPRATETDGVPFVPSRASTSNGAFSARAPGLAQSDIPF